jgi:hypothetical protein
MIDTNSSRIGQEVIIDESLLSNDSAKKLYEEMENFLDEIRSMVTASTAATTTNADLRASQLIFAKR